MDFHAEQVARIARGWNAAADGYDAYYAPRFAPWVTVAVRALPSEELPAGSVLVPCCGTFPELGVLLRHLPDRAITGIDISSGMTAMARQRAAGNPLVGLVERDVSTLDPQVVGDCAALVSVFGLQQLPEPHHALRSWVDALRPGGVLSVVYWPHSTEPDGPFTLLSDVLRERVPARDHSWEDRLVPELKAGGAIVERDEQVSFPMVHPDADAFFTSQFRSGPLLPMATIRGERFVARLREEFLRRAPKGEWHHRPHARHLVARSP